MEDGLKNVLATMIVTASHTLIYSAHKMLIYNNFQIKSKTYQMVFVIAILQLQPLMDLEIQKDNNIVKDLMEKETISNIL